MKHRKSTTSFASYRLFELLKFLSKTPATMQEIINYLKNIDPENREYSIITVYKYFNTFRTLGITFSKDGDKFVLEKLPFSFDFSKEDVLALKILESCSNYTEEDSMKKNIKEIFNALYPKMSNNLLDYYNSINIDNNFVTNNYSDLEKQLIDSFEKFSKDGLRVCITFKESNDIENNIEVDLVDLDYKDNTVYFKVYDSIKGRIISLNIKKIISMTQIPQKSKGLFCPTTVSYTIKDSLKRRYVLKDNEIVSNSDENSTVIVNKGEDKDRLIRRLIGYCNLCEIKTPKSYRNDLISELDAMLQNYK